MKSCIGLNSHTKIPIVIKIARDFVFDVLAKIVLTHQRTSVNRSRSHLIQPHGQCKFC